MIKNSIYKNYLVIIFLGFSNNIFSRNYCQNCCDCCKEKGEEESEEEIILKKNNFEYNWDIHPEGHRSLIAFWHTAYHIL